MEALVSGFGRKMMIIIRNCDDATQPPAFHSLGVWGWVRVKVGLSFGVADMD